MCTRVLVLLALQLGFAFCFNWDIVVLDAGKRFKFYKNGTLTDTEHIPLAKEIYSITYDPVHYRVLFVDNQNGNEKISSFDLSTKNIEPLVTIQSGKYMSVTYDPVTQVLFWRKNWNVIYSFSLNPASSNKAVDGNLVVTLNQECRDIAVDSCGRYIYWITNEQIERARFDGSEREVLIDSTVNYRFSLAIDQQTQKIYWTERLHSADKRVSIESADFKGKNRKTLYIIENETEAGSLAVSNDFIYWTSIDQKTIWQILKNDHLEAKLFSTFNYNHYIYDVIAANYSLKEQFKGNQNCEGYTGERCDISVCQNYCLQGNCSVSAEGQPKCSCEAGYSGERCEVNACHGYCLNSGLCFLNEEDNPVCQCKTDYEGERCTVSICKDYCFQGNCSASAEGQPICSCTDGYSGERCEVNGCHKHCLNDGICSLNEEDEPVCECATDYEGERCEVSTTHTGVHTDNTTQHALRDLRRQVRQVIKEELKRAQQFFSDKIDEYEVNI